MTRAGHQCITILDFGSQYTQLIARRIREQQVFCEVLPWNTNPEEIIAGKPAGIILSGGPDSVYDQDAPTLDHGLLSTGVPLLGVCFGMQLMVKELGGQVEGGGRREYGHAELQVDPGSTILEGLSEVEPVWMSHGDEVRKAPDGFEVVGRTRSGDVAAMECRARGLYALLFHPEVAHTPGGSRVLRNFLYEICGCTGDWTMAGFARDSVEGIRRQVGDKGRILCGVSGGVDSTVAAVLMHRAVGSRLHPLFIDTGLLRQGEAREVLARFRDKLGIPVSHREAASIFLSALKGAIDPEEKRKIVGEVFVKVFEDEARGEGDAGFLGQGTLYPDRIESSSGKGASVTIKTHHNVGGLPEKMDLQLVEPLRDLFKDEVRALGREVGLDESLIGRHPFPGPGLSVRIPGEVTVERLETLRMADAIFVDEIIKAGLYDQIAQAFAVLLPVRAVGVMGDLRTYENVLALRAVETSDFMTATWSRLPHDLLAHVSSRIVNEVKGINRVVYDISSKPPATIEWE